MRSPLKIGYLGVGRYIPSVKITNAHLEQIVDTSDEWIIQRTGIRTRYILGENETMLLMAVEAAKTALANAGLEPQQIRYLQVGVNTHLRFPSLASLIQYELNLKNASAADISAGCSGFIFSVENIFNQLHADWLLGGEKNYGLAVGVDALSVVTDWTDRSTCVLFGDAAGVAVLGPVESGPILATYTRTQGEYAGLLYLDPFLSPALDDPKTVKMKHRISSVYPFLRMEGRKVFSVAVRTMMSDIRSVIDKYNRQAEEHFNVSDVQFVIPHQANLRIVRAVQVGLKLRKDQVYREGVIRYGNTSAATIPIGYVDEWDKRPGALEVDVAFGSGFASGAILRRMRG